MKKGAIVRIVKFAGTCNEYARVEKVEGRFAYVSNIGQPFAGTLGWYRVKQYELEEA